MKTKELLEAPIASLPKDAQSLIAKDMENIAAMAMRIANEIHGGDKRSYLKDLDELDYLYKRLRNQIFQ